MSLAQAALHRATPSAGIAPRSIFVPVSTCRSSVDDRQPERCGQRCVNRCSWRSVSATRRQSARVRVARPPRRSSPPDLRRTAGRPPSGSAVARSDLHGRGIGGARSPTRDQRRPGTETTDRGVPVDAELHTSLATPPVSGSMRVTSSPHCLSASIHGHIFSVRNVLKRSIPTCDFERVPPFANRLGAAGHAYGIFLACQGSSDGWRSRVRCSSPCSCISDDEIRGTTWRRVRY